MWPIRTTLNCWESCSYIWRRKMSSLTFLVLLRSPNQQKTKMTSRPTTTVNANIMNSSISLAWCSPASGITLQRACPIILAFPTRGFDHKIRATPNLECRVSSIRTVSRGSHPLSLMYAFCTNVPNYVHGVRCTYSTYAQLHNRHCKKVLWCGFVWNNDLLFFSCKTLEFLWLTIFTVVTMILSSATLGALLSTLGHFLHAEVSDNRTR